MAKRHYTKRTREARYDALIRQIARLEEGTHKKTALISVLKSRAEHLKSKVTPLPAAPEPANG